MYNREVTASSSNAQYSRYLELLEALKKEYETLAFDSTSANAGLRAYREDLEQKIQAQLNEVAYMQKTIIELERAYLKMKFNYEEEIGKLRKELEGKRLNGLVNVSANPTSSLPVFIQNASLSGHPSASVISLPQIDSLQPQTKRVRIDENGNGHIQSSATEHIPNYSEPMNSSSISGSAGDMPFNESGFDSNADMRRKQSAPGNYPIGNGPQEPFSTSANSPYKSNSLSQYPISVDVNSQFKKDGNDWRIIYNPRLSKEIDVDLRNCFLHKEVVSCVRFSPNGAFLATGSNKIISLFDTVEGSLYAELDIPNTAEKEVFIRSIAFSPDSKFIAVGSEDSMIRVWNVEEQSIVKTFSFHQQDVYSVEYSTNGRYLVSGSGDRTIKIIDIEKEEVVTTLDAFPCLSANETKEYGITSIAISKDGCLIASGCIDKMIRIWEFSTGRRISILEGHSESIYSLCFSPDSRFIASASLDNSIILWERQSPSPDCNNQVGNSIKSPSSSFPIYKIRNVITGHKHFVLSVAFTPDGKYIISGSRDMSIHFWNISSAATQLIIQGHTDTVFSISISDDYLLLASGSGDKSARIWSLTIPEHAVEPNPRQILNENEGERTDERDENTEDNNDEEYDPTPVSSPIHATNYENDDAPHSDGEDSLDVESDNE